MLEPRVPDLGADDPPRAIEQLLRGYARGTLEPYMHALVEGHLILSEENRPFVRALENEAGDEIDSIQPQSSSRTARDHVLAAIYAGGWYGRARPPQIDPAMPDPIARLVGAPLDSLPWKFAAFGVKRHILKQSGRGTAALYTVAPGRRIPSHSHTGLEATLVLKGAFIDHGGRHVRGGISVANDAIDHCPAADPDEACVCFAVTEGPIRLTGPIGGILQRVLGR